MPCHWFVPYRFRNVLSRFGASYKLGPNPKPVFDAVTSKANKHFFFPQRHAHPYIHPPSILMFVDCWHVSHHWSKIIKPRAVQNQPTRHVVLNACYRLITFLMTTFTA